jgi:RNA polymerase sigma-70 factor (ECF subfamily)
MESEQERFWKLLKPEYHRAMMFCRKLIGDRDAGDDLYQDALVIAYTKIGDLRDPAAFRPWLYRIIVSTFHSTVRRPWWKRRVPWTPGLERMLTTADPAPALDARRWLERVFHSVSPDEQTLIALHELEGWPVADLAELFGKSEAAVKTGLFRARRKMKNALQKLSQQATHRRSDTANKRKKTDALS